MKDIEIFKNAEFGEVRVLEINGDPWFVAKDVADILGYSETAMMTRRLDDDEISKFASADLADSNPKARELTIINESGLYNAIIGSKKSESKRFKKWVTSEVLPSIRKKGSYSLDDTKKLPMSYSEALRLLATEVEEKEKLLLENNEMKPKAEFFDAVADSKDAIDIGTVSKVLGINGLGRNNLFELLRQKGILMNNNQPYQTYVDRGWFRIVEQKYSKPDGTNCINIKTLVYQKGVDGIRGIVKKNIGQLGEN